MSEVYYFTHPTPQGVTRVTARPDADGILRINLDIDNGTPEGIKDVIYVQTPNTRRHRRNLLVSGHAIGTATGVAGATIATWVGNPAAAAALRPWWAGAIMPALYFAVLAALLTYRPRKHQPDEDDA